MALAAGARLGSYEILSALGSGGMGEVYRARDAKLNRDVALKILPAEFGLDSDRLARFRREAQVLASLNHPNIAAIYGLEESTGTQALVLELVEGPTLADRIAKGPLPLDEVLAIARQIAAALEAAHEQGIIHRDLKPANVKVRDDGTVKVLDFGLARVVESSGSALNASGANLTHSPTITSPALMTGVGMLLGTAAYMSPEQAKGRVADKRSDIWALGCVLYEMLTGKRAFEGEDVGDTLASVLKSEPAWAALPAGTPPSIRALLRRCLDKDQRRRVADVSVALFAIDEAAFDDSNRSSAVVPQRPRHWAWVSRAAMSLITAAAVMLVGVMYLTRALPDRRVIRFVISPPDGWMLERLSFAPLAVSPDGRRLVFQARPRD